MEAVDVVDPVETFDQPTVRAIAKTASPPPRAGYRPIRFFAADGVYLVGRLWGTGDVGVILAHLTNRMLVLEGNRPPPATKPGEVLLSVESIAVAYGGDSAARPKPHPDLIVLNPSLTLLTLAAMLARFFR